MSELRGDEGSLRIANRLDAILIREFRRPGKGAP
jgi:hypothetical protein